MLAKCASTSHQADIERFVGLAVTIKTSPLYHPRKSLSAGVHFLSKCFLRRLLLLSRLLALSLSPATLFIAIRMFSRNFSIRKVSFAIPKKFSFLERKEFGRNTSNSVRLFARFEIEIENEIFHSRLKMIYIRLIMLIWPPTDWQIIPLAAISLK